MKNNLFYLTGVAYQLNYTGIFTSCINSVNNEYLEQQLIEIENQRIRKATNN